MGIGFFIRQLAKMFVQRGVLPLVYRLYCNHDVIEGKILFADAHHAKRYGNMIPLYDRLEELGYHPTDLCANFQEMSFFRLISYLLKFMKEYATAEMIFISDYFLPVSSCKKRQVTKVIQLWHAGGTMKKMGYDAQDDIPSYYKGSPTANYDLVTASSKACVPVWAGAWHLPETTVQPLGLARTDVYYDPDWNRANIQRFYEVYPEAKGKKIGIYAPSFEGNAAHPYNHGLTSGILDVMKALEKDWFFVVRLHPHMERLYPQYACKMTTEELFSAADLLITDYSSVLFDYLIYQKPLLLYAPDLAMYEQQRGFYLNYRELPAPILATPEEFQKAIQTEAWKPYQQDLQACFETFMAACDGHATDRILRSAGISLERG